MQDQWSNHEYWPNIGRKKEIAYLRNLSEVNSIFIVFMYSLYLLIYKLDLCIM